jgi:uncharacterized membrane protein
MATDLRPVPPGAPRDATLLEVLGELAAAGYDRDMFVREEDGWVCCGVCRSCQAPDQLLLDGLRRLEGASDPADMAAVLAVTCAQCHARGTAVVRFGPEATAGEAILLRSIDDVRPRGLDVAERQATPRIRQDDWHLDRTGDQEPLEAAGGAVQDLIHRLESIEALDKLQPFIRDRVASLPEPVRRALSGDWMGHSLHPALTDLPIGFWTSAFVLDLLPTRRTARTSTALVGLGVATAVPTAATGLVEWVQLPPEKRRVGVAHLVANVAATTAYTASFLARVRGHRARGVVLGMLGATLATAGGALGGHLAFGKADPKPDDVDPTLTPAP